MRGRLLPIVILGLMWLIAGNVGKTFGDVMVIIIALCVLLCGFMVLYMVFVQGRSFSYRGPWAAPEADGDVVDDNPVDGGHDA